MQEDTVEMEQDGERAQLLQSILNLLLDAGYFRAHISALTPFDKLTGGLAWCITFSKVEVDFDTFYDDDATLYYKIKVGESIEEALQRMGCPHLLQAHQIQGLDYQAVLPVVRWLVKRVLATLDEFGDQARRYAHVRYQETYKLPSEATMQESRLVSMEADVQASTLQSVQQLYTMSSTGVPSSGASVLSSVDVLTSTVPLKLDIDITEVGTATTLNSDVSQRLEGIERADEEYAAEVLDLEAKRKVQERRISQLQEQGSFALDSWKNLKRSIAEQDERMARIEASLHELQATAKASGVEKLVEKLVGLLERSKVSDREQDNFRVKCRERRSELQSRLKKYMDLETNSPEDDERGAEIDKAFQVDQQKWELLKRELATKNLAVAAIQRRLGEMPSQTELMQYERRFVELYLHIQRKLRETRKYFATYNALAEANGLALKELSLLNSIRSQFEAAVTTPDGRAQFVSSLESITKGVEQKLDHIERRYEAEQNMYTSLKEKFSATVGAQRQYYALVKAFQDECARVEKMQAKLRRAGHA